MSLRLDVGDYGIDYLTLTAKNNMSTCIRDYVDN